MSPNQYEEGKQVLGNHIIKDLNNMVFSYVGGREFISTWEITDDDLTLVFPLSKTGTYDFVIDWGDDETERYKGEGELKHIYSKSGLKTIRVTGQCYGLTFENRKVTANKIRDVLQWESTVAVKTN
jgi:hypothetical protein